MICSTESQYWVGLAELAMIFFLFGNSKAANPANSPQHQLKKFSVIFYDE